MSNSMTRERHTDHEPTYVLLLPKLPVVINFLDFSRLGKMGSENSQT